MSGPSEPVKMRLEHRPKQCQQQNYGSEGLVIRILPGAFSVTLAPARNRNYSLKIRPDLSVFLVADPANPF